MNRTGVAVVWVSWTVGSIALYFVGSGATGALAIFATLWWKNWALITVVDVTLAVLVMAPRLLRSSR